jgi:hypothetical protein
VSRIAEHYLGDNYPNAAGFKEPTTSRDAADAITPTLNERQQEVVRELRAVGIEGLTADQTAARLGRDEKAVRPRFTELGPRHLGVIEKTGERRVNESGLAAAVWRIKVIA